MRDVRAWQERLGRLSAPHPDSWTPPIDVSETATRSVVAAEVPGLSRTFDFADRVGVSVVTAVVTNGVLTVTLPKAVPPPRRIEVR